MANNQYVIINPSVTNLIEYSSFNKNFLIDYSYPADLTTPPDETYDYEFHTVIYDENLPQFAKDNIIITKTGEKSFNMAGEFSDVFQKDIRYIDSNFQKQQTGYFNDLITDNSAAVYKYVPPSLTTIKFIFQVKMKPLGNTDIVPDENILHTYDFSFLITYNHAVNNTKFKQIIEQGIYYKRAKAAGYIE